MNCYMLIGLPGSGKSYFAATVLSHITSIGTDNFIEKMKEEDETYSQAWPRLIKTATKVFEHALRLNDIREDLVIDRTNMTIASRKKVMDALRARDPIINFHAIVFHASENTLLQRYQERGEAKFIPPTAILGMQKRFQPPTEEERFATIWHIQS